MNILFKNKKIKVCFLVLYYMIIYNSIIFAQDDFFKSRDIYDHRNFMEPLNNEIIAKARKSITLEEGFDTDNNDAEFIIDPDVPFYPWPVTSPKNFHQIIKYGKNESVVAQAIAYYDALARVSELSVFETVIYS